MKRVVRNLVLVLLGALVLGVLYSIFIYPLFAVEPGSLCCGERGERGEREYVYTSQPDGEMGWTRIKQTGGETP